MLTPGKQQHSHPWGKFDEAAGVSHHLAHHCADVAACLEELIAVPVFRCRLEQAAGAALSAMVVQRLAVIGFLHDVGKLHPGFQAKGWPVGVWRWPKRGHVQEGAALFSADSPAGMDRLLCVEQLIDWGVDESLLYSSLAHHGRPFVMAHSASQLWNRVKTSAVNYDPMAEAILLGAALRNWFPLAFSPGGPEMPKRAQFQHLFCGLVSLADWIGSDKRFFAFRTEFDPDYIRHARDRAQRAILAVGLNVTQYRAHLATDLSFASVMGFAMPNAAQRAVSEFPADEQLVILEAETGAGKTEAAFWWFVRLFNAGKVDGLYFALPTRSSAVQLHQRVNQMLKRLLGVGAPEAVLAVPGYLKAGEVEGETLPGWKVLWEDEGSVSEEELLARWAAESSKRYLAAMVAVGTVDQAMLAGLQVKHAHLRGAALSRSLLVIDEVHASDSYMTEVQNNLLRIHRERGGYALLMSATLGSRARCHWLGQVEPSFESAVETSYPAIWGIGSRTPVSIAAPERHKNVDMSTIPSMDAEICARMAMQAAQCRARVLVIRNTVTAAVETWRAVGKLGGENLLLRIGDGPALHHGRFAPEDRRLLDRAVELALSPKSRDSDGVIVIGTQTLEQSLDVDADLLISDLCPIDVLLQRIGRLHRHVHVVRPPGYEKPHCHVLIPANGLEPLLRPDFYNGLGAWREKQGYNGIYRDLSMLELTRRLVGEHPEWALPAMNRLLVESATHEERIEALHSELGKTWRDYRNDVVGQEIADRGAGKLVALHTDIPFADPNALFASDEERIRTRLGAEGARITFTEAIPGPFGQAISGVTLPAHWSRGLDTKDPIRPKLVNGLITFEVGDRVFAYSRSGLSKGSK